MRLIDIEHLEKHLMELGWFEPDEFDREIKLKCILDHEPTAYDVDKVVERLEERIENFKSLNPDDEIVDAAIKETQRNIEIVKSGGVE